MARLPDPAELDRPWVGAYPPGVPPTYRLPAVPLTRFLDDAARDFPQHGAVVAGGVTLDFDALRLHVDRVATWLAASGVSPGDRVLVGLPNVAAHPVVLFACWRAGAVVVPVVPGAEVERLAAIAGDAEIRAAIADASVLQALRRSGALPPTALQVTGQEWSRPRRLRRTLDRLRPSRDGDDHTPTLADVVEVGGPRSAPPPAAPDAPAVIAYLHHDLRGVVLTHANLVANAFQSRLWIPDIQAGRERVLIADPLGEVAPLTLGLLAATLSAATSVLVDRPSPEALARAVHDSGATLFPTTPQRLRAVAAAGDSRRRDLSSLRVVLAVGGPLDPELAATLESLTGHARVREAYGLAEAGPLTHAQPIYGRIAPGAMGLPVTDTVALVVDPDDLGRRLAPGEAGVLVIHGPQVASGYWRRPDATAERFVDGWLVTDDIVTVDDDGVFHHVGRRGQIGRRNGRVVAPGGIEAVLRRHPDVDDVGVVITDDHIIAAVVRRRRSRTTADDLATHCRSLLDAVEVPDRIELVDALPHVEGEVSREELRRQLLGR